jgi:branched-chain amino acid transport system substrate-binding protein
MLPAARFPMIMLALTVMLASCAPTGGAPAGTASGAPGKGSASAPAAQPAQSQPASAQSPIKIGYLNDASGALSTLAPAHTNAIQLALDEVNRTVGGRSVQFIVEDSASTPATAANKVRKLVEQDGIHILMGPMNSASALAIREYVTEKKPLWMVSQSSVLALTSPKAPNVFRTALADRQPHQPFGNHVAQRLGYRRVATVALDYAPGVEQQAGFEKLFQAAGGDVVQKVFIPLGSPDHAPYIGNINTDQIDAVVVIMWGVDAIRFLQQSAEYGLGQRKPIIGYGMIDEDTMPATGQAAVGIVNWYDYSASLDNPENKRFVESYKAKYNAVPTAVAVHGYEGMRAVLAGLEQVGGNVEAADRLIAALEKLELKVPRGTLKFDENHQAILPMYLFRVENVGGTLINRPIETFPDVKLAAD